MAEDKNTKRIRESKEEAAAMLDALQSITDTIQESISALADGLDDANTSAEIISKTMQRGIVKELQQSVKNQEEIVKLQAQAARGEAKASDVAKMKKKLLDNQALAQAKLVNLQRNTAGLNKEDVEAMVKKQEEYLAYLKSQEDELNNINTINDSLILQGGLTKAIGKNIKEYITNLDKSGIAAALLNEELEAGEKLMLAGEAAIIALAKGAMEASDNINAIQKATGISYMNARRLQAEFAIVAINTNKAYVNSVELNKSFAALTETTGLLLDYSGDTLVTMTGLTKQMGLSAEAGAQLSLLASMQSSDTEAVLDNIDATVNAVNKQNKTAVSLKQIYNDISSASKAIVVSLGMSPELLAEAATQARALGLSLGEVDKIAESLLNFEQSIEAELSAELLTGKNINLEKARQLALDNDLAGLAEEIKDNTALTESFATGNRIQQQALADTLGMSRDELAGMVYQQELMSMGQDKFIEKYGEQAHQQLMAQSAQEKFADTMTKIQTIIADMALTFAPIIDFVAYLAEQTWAAYTALALIGGLSLAKTLGSLATMGVQLGIISLESITAASALTLGLGAIAIVAAIATIAGVVASQRKQKEQRVQDGIAPPDRGPFTITDAYNSTAITADGDGIAISPNINRGGGDDRMIALLEKIANKNSNVYMDSQKVGTTMAMSYSKA